jgi:hypothetical protein
MNGMLKLTSATITGGLIAVVPTPSRACDILAMERTVIVSGLPARQSGNLCIALRNGWQCRKSNADQSGTIAIREVGDLTGPVWFVPTAGISCSAKPEISINETNQRFWSFLQTLLAFLTGAVLTYLPILAERRERSREAFNSWLGDYEKQLDDYRRNDQIDPYPKPMPHVRKSETIRLARINERARELLRDLGPPQSAGNVARNAFAESVISAIRDIRR